MIFFKNMYLFKYVPKKFISFDFTLYLGNNGIILFTAVDVLMMFSEDSKGNCYTCNRYIIIKLFYFMGNNTNSCN